MTTIEEAKQVEKMRTILVEKGQPAREAAEKKQASLTRTLATLKKQLKENEEDIEIVPSSHCQQMNCEIQEAKAQIAQTESMLRVITIALT